METVNKSSKANLNEVSEDLKIEFAAVSLTEIDNKIKGSLLL